MIRLTKANIGQESVLSDRRASGRAHSTPIAPIAQVNGTAHRRQVERERIGKARRQIGCGADRQRRQPQRANFGTLIWAITRRPPLHHRAAFDQTEPRQDRAQPGHAQLYFPSPQHRPPARARGQRRSNLDRTPVRSTCASR
jgi:hypothetical protein